VWFPSEDVFDSIPHRAFCVPMLLIGTKDLSAALRICSPRLQTRGISCSSRLPRMGLRGPSLCRSWGGEPRTRRTGFQPVWHGCRYLAPKYVAATCAVPIPRDCAGCHALRFL
jgi:hypothetical protein